MRAMCKRSSKSEYAKSKPRGLAKGGKFVSGASRCILRMDLQCLGVVGVSPVFSSKQLILFSDCSCGE